MMGSMIDKIKKNDLYVTFRELKGNPKWSIMTEPLWFIPFSLYTPFASLYMYERGVDSGQIGWIISLGFFLQVIFGIMGGVITDKLGRRMTTFLFDMISWVIPCLLWAFADNFWWFLIAAMINASYQITNTSWNCLFIEDCPANHLTNAFTMIHVCGMLSVFFSPIAIVFVDMYSVVEVVSVLYIISAISMALKFILLYIYGGETEVGKQRKIETAGVSAWKLFSGYSEVVGKVCKSSRMLFVVLFMAITNIILITTNNFFALYITQTLHISDGWVAVFPMVRTALMLLFVIFLQNAVNRMKMRNSLLFGFVAYAASHLVILFAPEKNIWMIIAYTILEAVAYAVITPRKDALMAFYVEVKERSRIYAIFNSGMIALSAPFGVIIGELYAWSPSYPFFLNIGLFLLASILILRVGAIATYDEETKVIGNKK